MVLEIPHIAGETRNSTGANKILFRSLFICILWLFAVKYSFANETRVSFKHNPKESYEIKSFKQGYLTYCSLDDLSDLLSLNLKNLNENKIAELSLKKDILRILSNSPFVYLKNRADNTVKMIQAPVNFIKLNGETYFPVQTFLKILCQSSKIDMSYSSEKDNLVINTKISVTKNSSDKSEISALKVLKKANGYTIRIPAKRKVRITHVFDKEENIITLKMTGLKINQKKFASSGSGGVFKKVTVKQLPGASEVKFALNDNIESCDVFQSDKTNDIYLLLFQKFSIDSMFKAEKRKSKIKELAESEHKKKKWKLDMVVIDPGHGGIDPGCIGISKKYEKNIVLPLALKLGKLLESKLKLKVSYTRKTDISIPIYKRGQIANEKKGDLFISIHCNSLPKGHSNINGFETYILRPGRTDEAIAVAERENAVIKYEEDYEKRYKHLSDENFILTTIAQNAYVKFSESFADIIDETVSNNLSIKSKGVHQAGFYVLVGASMPSVLVECGYLSNKKDEAFLATNAGQQKTAECIYKAIKEFINTYQKALKEGD
jgi:N-acetylmuramoyl-L-alanine amidase